MPYRQKRRQVVPKIVVEIEWDRICGFCEGEGNHLVHPALDSAENIYETCPICKGAGHLEEPYWLNADNVALALHACCKNTKFQVRQLIPAPSAGTFNVDIDAWPGTECPEVALHIKE